MSKINHNKKVNISIVGIVGIPSQYGGFETLVEYLVRKKKDDNIKYTVFCSTEVHKERLSEYYNTKLKYININANGMSSMFYDLICMLLSLKANIMVILGVSGGIFFPIIRLLYKGKIIINIDGLEWKREKWGIVARFILRISERFAIKFSDVVIGDNQAIIEYIFKKYKRNAVLIGYGADHDI